MLLVKDLSVAINFTNFSRIAPILLLITI